MLFKIALVVLAGIALALVYVLWLRPVLEKIGIVRPLPDDVSGVRNRLSAYIGQSWTIAWQWIVGAVGTAFTLVLSFAETIGQPELKAQIAQVFKDHPQGVTLGFIIVALITGMARMRSLGK